jgi:hypothetical protein
MRESAVVVLALAGAFGAAAAGEQEDARAVIDRAITAQGGEAALARAKTLERSGSGVMLYVGAEVPFTEETVLALPGRLRMTIDLAKRVRTTLVLNGDRGWLSAGGPAQELGKERLGEAQEEAYVLWVSTLLPLRKEPFTLTPLPDDKGGDGKPAAVVKAANPGHPDVRLFFDKESGLLTRIERRAREAGAELEKTYLLGDYKDVDGVKLPGRYVELQNGRKITERKSTAYKLLTSVDEGQFARP